MVSNVTPCAASRSAAAALLARRGQWHQHDLIASVYRSKPILTEGVGAPARYFHSRGASAGPDKGSTFRFELFSEILARVSAIVETADCTASALQAIDRMRPDVIVSDIAMPEEDGYILMRKLRAHSDGLIAKTPAVAVTAHARAEDRQNAFAAGFQRYVSKPVQPKDLVGTVGALLAAGAAD